MFDLIIKEAASRFGLGDKAGPLVQMLLAYITNKDTGGISGLLNKFASNGIGDIAKSWLGGGANALPVSATQLESVLGGSGGLIGNAASKLGLGGSVVSSALGYLLPAVIGKLTPGGTVPTSFSSDVLGFITGGASALTGAAAGAAGAASVAASKVVGSAGHAASTAMNTGAKAAADAGGGLMKWLPWIAVIAAGLFALSYCNKGGVDATKQSIGTAGTTTSAASTTATTTTDTAAKAASDAAAATKATADAAAKAAAEAVPAGSGLVAYTHDGAPALKVYFDTGKTDVATGFADTGKALIEHLKSNAASKAIVSGYNDPTGNAAANAELSKNRAKAVRAALVAAGLAEDRVVLEKPAETVGSTLSNSEARRVEVTVRK